MKGKIKNWVCIVVAVTTLVILEQPSGAADLNLNLKTATTGTYTNLMKGVRDKVKDPNLKYGGTDLPVQAAPTNPPKYLYIDIKADLGTVTIGLDKNNLYVVGYLENIDGTKKAHFLQDASTYTKTSAFPDAKNRVDMSFEGTYIDLERAAGMSRAGLGLGGIPLKKYINQLYQDKTLNRQNEAKFMLIVIQMIAEAARFKYIQYNIGQNFVANAYYPDTKALTLENNWAVTTKAIKSAVKNVPFLDLSGVIWQTFDNLVKDMGLLKYEGKALLYPFYIDDLSI